MRTRSKIPKSRYINGVFELVLIPDNAEVISEYVGES